LRGGDQERVDLGGCPTGGRPAFDLCQVRPAIRFSADVPVRYLRVASVVLPRSIAGAPVRTKGAGAAAPHPTLAPHLRLASRSGDHVRATCISGLLVASHGAVKLASMDSGRWTGGVGALCVNAYSVRGPPTERRRFRILDR